MIGGEKLTDARAEPIDARQRCCDRQVERQNRRQGCQFQRSASMWKAAGWSANYRQANGLHRARCNSRSLRNVLQREPGELGI